MDIAKQIETLRLKTEGRSGVPRGGGGFRVFKPPLPRNSEGRPKKRAKFNPIVKTVKKIAEFRTPTHQDARKKNAVKF